jgi:hypothetical protein
MGKTNRVSRENPCKLMGDAMKLLGSKCVFCGSEEGLDFDCWDQAEQVSNIASKIRSTTTLLDTVKNYRLLCKSCHAMRSRAERRAMDRLWQMLPLDVRLSLVEDQRRAEN